MKKNKVAYFRKVHKKNKPLILLNIWDVASAHKLSTQKIKLIPTGSYAMSDYYGYQDGEQMPFNELLDYVKEMDPVNNYITVDIETGYAANLAELAQNIEAIVESGAVGINIEDKKSNTEALYSVAEQSERLVAIKQKLAELKQDLFINVRTDTYFTGDSNENNQNEQLLEQTITRIKAYEKTGIDGIFIPGLKNTEHIKKIAAQTTLPINIMLDIKEDSISDYLNSGVSRISFGPSIYLFYNENKDPDEFFPSILARLSKYEEQDSIELFKLP